MHVDTSRDGVKKRCILLTKLAWKRLMKSLQPLNYDMEPKIQGRVHSGKLRIFKWIKEWVYFGEGGLI